MKIIKCNISSIKNEEFVTFCLHLIHYCKHPYGSNTTKTIYISSVKALKDLLKHIANLFFWKIVVREQKIWHKFRYCFAYMNIHDEKHKLNDDLRLLLLNMSYVNAQSIICIWSWKEGCFSSLAIQYINCLRSSNLTPSLYKRFPQPYNCAMNHN